MKSKLKDKLEIVKQLFFLIWTFCVYLPVGLGTFVFIHSGIERDRILFTEQMVWLGVLVLYAIYLYLPWKKNDIKRTI